MKKLCSIAISAFLFSGCSTSAVNSGSKVAIRQIEVAHPILISVRAYQATSVTHGESGKFSRIDLFPEKGLTKGLRESFSAAFGSRIVAQNINQKTISIKGASKDTEVKALTEQFLRQSLAGAPAQYYVDVSGLGYGYGHPLGTGSALRGIWFVFHIATLGIIPFRTSERIELKIDLRNSNRDIIDHMTRSVPITSWAGIAIPLVKGDREEYYRDLANVVLSAIGPVLKRRTTIKEMPHESTAQQSHRGHSSHLNRRERS